MRKSRNICGPLVRRLRRERGWSIRQLAARVTAAGVKMSDQDVEAIESGKEPVLDRQVLALSVALVVTVHYLVAGRESKPHR